MASAEVSGNIVKLVNRMVGYEDVIQWNIPHESSEGFIENVSGKILCVRQHADSDKMEVFWNAEKETYPKDQKWFRGKTDDRKYFTLKHVESKMFLTGHNDEGFIVERNNCSFLWVFEILKN